jgi:small subunit ribosomal protein S16
MVIIRLARGGAKKRPFFNIVVADSRSPRDGRYKERVGYFNPVAQGKEIRLFVQQERVSHWINLGAQLSDRVSSLLKEYAQQGAAETVNAKDKKPEAAKSKAAVGGQSEESKPAE